MDAYANAYTLVVFAFIELQNSDSSISYHFVFLPLPSFCLSLSLPCLISFDVISCCISRRPLLLWLRIADYWCMKMASDVFNFQRCIICQQNQTGWFFHVIECKIQQSLTNAPLNNFFTQERFFDVQKKIEEKQIKNTLMCIYTLRQS